MRKIGILVADRMGQLSQSFCLQKMREAGIDTTIVYSSYFSSGVRSNYKVSSMGQLSRVLGGFDNEDVVACSTMSRSYRDMVRYGCPTTGYARGYSARLDTGEFVFDRRALDRALGGESMVFSVGSFRNAVSGAAGPVRKVPDSREVSVSVEDVVPVIVSVTTYKRRFPILDRSLGSILNQSVRPERVCVAVDECDIGYIDGFLKNAVDSGVVELLVGDRKYGPHNKYLHAMRKYRDRPVITFDDDMVYRPGAIESLWRCHLAHPGCVCARRAHRIRWNDDGTPMPYASWENQCVSVTYPSFDLLATGVGGVLYPAGLFSWTDDDLKMMAACRNDDIFLKQAENRIGVPTVITGDPKDVDLRIRDHGAQDEALSIKNLRGGNDDEMARVGLSRVSRGNVSGKAPFFRVIVPVYRSVRTLKRAIGSIQQQTFGDYVVSVCDDGSPERDAEENRKTVESLGERGVFTAHDKNYFAGKARNTAMAAVPESEYTLFLDADDRFSYPGLFEDLYKFIVLHGFPDVVALPANRRSQGSSLDYTLKHATSVELYATDRRFETPWSKCIKTSKVKPFQEGLRRCNDVLQHWLVVDDIESVAPFNKIAVDYLEDSETTMFGKGVAGTKNRQTIPALTGYLKCAEALLETKWRHAYVSRSAASEAKAIVLNLMPNLIKFGGLSQLEKVKEDFDHAI